MIIEVLFAIGSALLVTGLFLYGVYETYTRGRRVLSSAGMVSESVPVESTPDLPDSAEAKKLCELLSPSIKGDVTTASTERVKYSRDTSIFTVTPEVIVYPKDADDVSALVRGVHVARTAGIQATITARSAGTDMSGGPLGNSIIAVFTRHMNQLTEVGDGYAVTEPGVFYRDFEKATLASGRQLLPSYPASREICAMGGVVNNNSGGERTLEYGKTEKYIEAVDVVLSDGSRTTFKALTPNELLGKQKLQTFEGDIYRRMTKLISDNAEVIEKARPHVSKNSAGYALWNVVDKATGTFNLAKLICGAQGTLALTTSMRLRLVKDEPNRAMLVIFLSDLSILPEIVKRILPFTPESFESYDDKTFTLAVKFLPQMLMQMGFFKAARLGFSFIPEVGLVLKGGVPKLVLMAEFSEQSAADALHVAEKAQQAIASLGLRTRINRNERESEKYWVVRRESFSLLRKNVHGLYAAPFIDDFVVPPETYPEFLPQLNALLSPYADKFIYTIAGHIGNGNFHIIPLMDMTKPEVREIILELAPKVYDLVIKYGGTTTGEHNDGIIRTPYLEQLFGTKMTDLFAQTKKIFDPNGIFNPGKKVGGTFEDIKRDMITKI